MMHRSKLAVVVCGALLALGCKGKGKDTAVDETPTPAQKDSNGEDTPAKKDEAPKKKAEPIAEAKIKGLVDAWLAAQNGGDFDAYAASYATRMTGIKRVGSKKTTYSREGWLKDRKRMFKRKMTVEMADIDIANGAKTARVRFTQTWASGKFKDVGPKQLIVVREDGGLRIAREEMLSSSVLSSKKDDKDLLASLMFRAPYQDVFVVSEAEEEWSTGEARSIEGSGDSSNRFAVKDANLDALDEETRGLIGNELTVYGPKGSCTEKIRSLEVMVGVTPHFGYDQTRWEEEEEGIEVEYDEAADMFGMGTHRLVAHTEGKCEGLVASLKKPRPAMVLQPADEATAKELASVIDGDYRATQSWKDLQADYKSYEEADGNWDSDVPMVPTLFVDEEGNRKIAVITTIVGDGCGDFLGEITVVFEVDADGKVEVLGEFQGSFQPEYALDLDGDGRLELVGNAVDMVENHTGILGATGGEYQVLDTVGWDYQDCPC